MMHILKVIKNRLADRLSPSQKHSSFAIDGTRQTANSPGVNGSLVTVIVSQGFIGYGTSLYFTNNGTN